jgi:hypothetical protein
VLLSMRIYIVRVVAARIVSATSSLQYGDATGVDENECKGDDGPTQ